MTNIGEKRCLLADEVKKPESMDQERSLYSCEGCSLAGIAASAKSEVKIRCLPEMNLKGYITKKLI